MRSHSTSFVMFLWSFKNLLNLRRSDRIISVSSAAKKSKRAGGRPPKPLEDPDLTDQAFKIRTNAILKEILDFLDKPENKG